MFYGGQDILQDISQEPFQHSNFVLFLVAVFSLCFKLILEVYKKMAYKQGLAYNQQLRKTVMNSLRNVYGPLSLILWFFGIAGGLLLHKYLGLESSGILKGNRFGKPLAIAFVFALVLFIPFIINPKLRYVYSQSVIHSLEISTYFRRFSYKKLAGIVNNNQVIELIKTSKKTTKDVAKTQEFPPKKCAGSSGPLDSNILDFRLPGQPDSLPPVV